MLININLKDKPNKCSECRFCTYEVGIMYPYCSLTLGIIENTRSIHSNCPIAHNKKFTWTSIITKIKNRFLRNKEG